MKFVPRHRFELKYRGRDNNELCLLLCLLSGFLRFPIAVAEYARNARDERANIWRTRLMYVLEALSTYNVYKPSPSCCRRDTKVTARFTDFLSGLYCHIYEHEQILHVIIRSDSSWLRWMASYREYEYSEASNTCTCRLYTSMFTIIFDGTERICSRVLQRFSESNDRIEFVRH